MYARFGGEATVLLAEGITCLTLSQYLAESASIDRLLEQGDLQAAHDTAHRLLQRCLAAGDDAYQGAAYDTAVVHLLLGRVLRRGGAAEAALELLSEARRRFQRLADAGDTAAERMASASIVERADCLWALGRLDEAASSYEKAIGRNEKLDDQRGVAVSKGNLGRVRLDQRRYAEALEIYAEARKIFSALGEPRSVATAWHQIGMVHQEAEQWDNAEGAYRQALAIWVQQGIRAHEADSLGQLGNLYNAMGRIEESVTFYRQAADIHVELGDGAKEGVARNNLADTLIKLGRYDDARREVHRAIECKKPFGHAATPWKTWMILHNLETAIGNAQAAADARQQAIETYLAYRRAGGESQTTIAQLCALTAQAIQQGDTAQAEQVLAQYSQVADPPTSFKAMIPKLQAILHGERNSALAADPNLDCDDAVELQLLLEVLGT